MGVRVTITTLASQDATVVQPARNQGGRLVVFAHGAGTTYAFSNDLGITWPTLRATSFLLAERGYVVVTPALLDTALGSQGHTWGNNASTTQLDSVVTAAKALPGCGAAKYALIGCSMGFFTVANHARRKSYAGIAGVLGLAPACKINTHRGTDAAQAANYATVNSAYGVTTDAGWNAIKATYEPIDFGTNFTCTVGLWTNSNDTVAVPSEADTLSATNATWMTRVNLGVSAGVNGHDFDLVTSASVDTWLGGLAW